jgi:hypothetical protein
LILAQGAELYVESPEGTPPSNYCMTWYFENQTFVIMVTIDCKNHFTILLVHIN